MSRYTDMIRSTAAEIYAETGAPSVVSIKYDRGSFNGNMPQLFPLAAGDMKRVFSILDRVPDYNDALTAAETIRTFCADMIRIYKDLEKSHGTPDGKTFCAAQVKRFSENVNAVADRYGLEHVDVEKAPRMKSAPVFVLESDSVTGAPRVACYDGKKFDKGGRTWHVYGKKCGRKTTYHITDPASGRRVTTVDKASAAAGVLTGEPLKKTLEFFETAEYADMCAEFSALLRQSEYAYMIDDASQAPQEATTATETAPAQPSAETATEAPETATTATETPAAGLDYDPDAVDVSAVLDRFNYRYNWLYNMRGAEFELDAFRDAVRIFDNDMTDADRAVLAGFNALRNDFIMSDREAAAFVMALTDVLNAPPVQAAQEAPTTDATTPTTGAERAAEDNAARPAEAPTTPAETPATAAAEPGQEEHGATSPAADPAETARTTCTAEELDRGPAATAETPQKARTTCKDAATGRRSATAPGGLVKRRQALRRLAIYGGARPVILRRVHGHGAPTVPRAAEGHINASSAAEARQKTPGGPAAVYDHTGVDIVPYGARSGPICKDPRRTVDRSTCGHTGRQRHDVRSSCGPAAGYILAPWEAIKGPPRTAARTAQRFKRVLTCCGWTCCRC